MWTREDDVKNGRFRPMSVNYLRAGLDGSGKLTSWSHRVAGDRVTPYVDPVRFEANKRRDGILMAGTDLIGYEVPHQLVEQIYKDTGVRTSPLRGIGFVANRFAAEGFLDEIIRQKGADPVAYRLDLLKGTPRGRRIVEAVAKASEWGRKREGRGMGFSYIDYSGSILAGAVEISLERATGQIKVHNVWCAIDCGLPIQPDNVVAQSESSIVYGLGLALMETVTIRNGAVVQSNFYDYTVPRQFDIPRMAVEVIKTDNAPSGVGQMATPLITPAVASAFAALTGRRLRHSPFTPDRVKKALA